MEYQEIINLFDETTNQPSKLRTRNWNKWWMMITVTLDSKRPQ